MNILILQHDKNDDPGYFKHLMLADGWNLTTIELNEGDTIPDDLDSFDAIFCMGGVMDTWMEKEYPWLIPEKRKIREFVIELEKPFVGICLGAQLLGEAVGGKVERANSPEIGIFDVTLAPEKENDPIFSQYPDTIKILEWHAYEVQGLEVNPNVNLLASSPITKYQIFRYKNHAYGIQFHIEVEEDTVLRWGNALETQAMLEDHFGPNALQKFDNKAQQNMVDMNRYARLFYENFKQMLIKNPF